jgi:hypothetical protein
MFNDIILLISKSRLTPNNPTIKTLLLWMNPCPTVGVRPKPYLSRQTSFNDEKI